MNDKEEIDESKDPYPDYDKDENGKPLSCCGDVLTEESGFRCRTCGENN